MARAVDFIPLIFLLIFLACFAWVGLQMYFYSQELAERGQKSLEKRNISYTREGVKVGVKERTAEEQADRAQKHVVNAWNLSTWPAYKSMFWNKDAQTSPGSTSAAASATSAKSRSKAS